MERVVKVAFALARQAERRRTAGRGVGCRWVMQHTRQHCPYHSIGLRAAHPRPRRRLAGARPPFIAGVANGLVIHHLELVGLRIVRRVGHKRLQAAKHDWFAFLLQPAGRWLSWHVIECRALVIGAAQGPALCCMGMRRRRPPTVHLANAGLPGLRQRNSVLTVGRRLHPLAFTTDGSTTASASDVLTSAAPPLRRCGGCGSPR